MFEKFTQANARDFRQRYEGTYGFFRKEDKSRVLTRLDSISDSVCIFSDARGVEFRLNADAEKDIGFEFLPPKSCWYNSSDGNVYLVSRAAARQFQRGISPKNTVIYKLVNNTIMPMRIDFANLEAVYSKAVAPAASVERLNKGNPFAISKQFALSKQLVFLYETPVGTFTNDAERNHFVIKLDEPALWRTEITDALRALHKTVEVS